MRNLQLHIIFSVLAMFFAVTSHGQFAENFNSTSNAQLEDDCWILDDMDVSTSSHMNTGANAPHIHGDATAFLFWTDFPSIYTPFFYFDGNTDVSFIHELSGTVFFAGAGMVAYLIAPNGTETQIGDRNGRFSPEAFNLNLTQVGYYRLAFRYGAIGVAANLDAEFDDFSTTASLIAPDIVETAVACMDEIVQYTPTGVVSTPNPYDFEYNWSWVGTPGGTLTEQTGNDRRARVNWNVGPGTYRLRADETYDNGNCNGRTFFIDVTVNELPDFAISIDTVCEDGQATMIFEALAGEAPYTVSYNDGSGVKTFTASTVSESVLLAAGADDVLITDVVDDNGCHADAALLRAYPIYYHPKPNTDPIYHY